MLKIDPFPESTDEGRAVIISLLGLIVSVVDVTFSITWKLSHENKEHNKKD